MLARQNKTNADSVLTASAAQSTSTSSSSALSATTGGTFSLPTALRRTVIKLGRSVLNYHVYTEKEEQKRIERISKERLKALKADDEEAYMKLIDTAKDTRITHLLRQTDSYLDSLAQAVMAQQSDSGRGIVFDSEDAPNEATFGAQIAPDDIREEKGKIDYYAVAHRITEKVSKQPGLLTGGTLKDYQLKGLQWMVSLYNNRLNGILADEMVRATISS
jgi:ATP-dependent helicase STH1/SNF2